MQTFLYTGREKYRTFQQALSLPGRSTFDLVERPGRPNMKINSATWAMHCFGREKSFSASVYYSSNVLPVESMNEELLVSMSATEHGRLSMELPKADAVNRKRRCGKLQAWSRLCLSAATLLPEVLVSSSNVTANAMSTVHKKTILLGCEEDPRINPCLGGLLTWAFKNVGDSKMFSQTSSNSQNVSVYLKLQALKAWIYFLKVAPVSRCRVPYAQSLAKIGMLFD